MPITLPEYKTSTRRANVGNGYSEHYGAIETAASYADYRIPPYPFKAFWLHGCTGPWELSIPGFLTMNYDQEIKDLPLLVAREDEEIKLKQSGYKNIRKIGLPIVYAKSIPQPKLRNSLLIVPIHTLPGTDFEDKRAFDIYAQEINKSKRFFSKIYVCLHASCISNGLWVSEFANIGVEVIRGADCLDSNCLNRVKTLFSTFEYVTTNGWGSHVAYALACGAKVSIFGTIPEITVDIMVKTDHCWQRNPESAKISLDQSTKIQERKFLKEFYREPIDGIVNQDLGRYLIGEDNKINRKEMRSVLKIAFGEDYKTQLRNFQARLQNICVRVKRKLKNSLS